MIEAPYTGANVRDANIYRSDLVMRSAGPDGASPHRREHAQRGATALRWRPVVERRPVRRRIRRRAGR